MPENESNESMNELIRGTDKPPEELLTSHERMAVEGLRQGVAPSMANDLWRLVGPAADLELDATIDSVAEVAEIKATRPHLFDDEETAFNRSLRGAGLAAYTPATNRGYGSANGGVANSGLLLAVSAEPHSMTDKIRAAFRARRSGGRGTGWEA